MMMPYAFRTVRQPSPKHDRVLGDMSYLVYLFHVPALALLGDSYFSLSLRQRLPGLVLVWIGVFTVSLAFWALVHRPLETRRKRFTSGRKTAAATSADLSSPSVVAMADPMIQENPAAVS
jgi:peptidoglycan/LPS O-acetylase OafA/YrhL